MRHKGTIAILANRPDEIESISLELGKRSIRPACVPTLEQLWSTLCETPCIGAAISVVSLVHLSDHGHELIRDIGPYLPVARFRLNPETGAIGVMSPSTGTGSSIDEFIAACVDKGPKRFRKNERFQKHLNVLVANDAGFTDPEPSFTFNISKDGCFAHTDHPWEVGDRIWVSIREPFKDFGIEGEVMRYIPWGIPFQPQGVGVRFLDPDSVDIARLIRYISPPRAPKVHFVGKV